MKKLIMHIKIWNSWRKRSANCMIHKLFVLFGIIKSPTFMAHKALKTYIPPKFEYKYIRED